MSEDDGNWYDGFADSEGNIADDKLEVLKGQRWIVSKHRQNSVLHGARAERQ